MSLLASLILILKLIFSYNVYGTNDITSWIRFSEIIQRFGTFKIYSLMQVYNHPPLMSWILKLVMFIVENTGLSFPFVFRCMPILADYVSILIIWKLLIKYEIRDKFLITIFCVLNPVNFFISGFHGNTDSLFICLVLLAIYLLESEKIVFSGLIFGLSFCIKIVPIILFPAFLIHLYEKRKKILFIFLTAIILTIVFSPYLMNDYRSVARNIFLYGGARGIWGVGFFLRLIIEYPHLPMIIRKLGAFAYYFHASYGVPLFLILLSFLLFRFKYKKQQTLLEDVFLTFCIFFVVTPGFGTQYLAWISFFALIVSWQQGVIYTFLGGFFLYRVYTYWSGGLTMYYANSFETAGRWARFEDILAIVLWVILCSMLVNFLLKNRLSGIQKR